MVCPKVKVGLYLIAVVPIFLVVVELVSLLTELSWLFGFVLVVGSFWLLDIADCCLEERIVADMIFRALEAEVFVVEKPPGMTELVLLFDLAREFVGCFVGIFVAVDVRNV